MIDMRTKLIGRFFSKIVQSGFRRHVEANTVFRDGTRPGAGR